MIGTGDITASSPISSLSLKDKEVLYVMRRLSSAGPDTFKKYPIEESVRIAQERDINIRERNELSNFVNSTRSARVLMRGWLWKRGRNRVPRCAFQQRYFVLFDNSRMIYFRQQARGEDESSWGEPIRTFYLSRCSNACCENYTGSLSISGAGTRRICRAFRFKIRGNTLILAHYDQEVTEDWYTAVGAVLEASLVQNFQRSWEDSSTS